MEFITQVKPPLPNCPAQPIISDDVVGGLFILVFGGYLLIRFMNMIDPRVKRKNSYNPDEYDR